MNEFIRLSTAKLFARSYKPRVTEYIRSVYIMLRDNMLLPFFFYNPAICVLFTVLMKIMKFVKHVGGTCLPFLSSGNLQRVGMSV